MYTLCKQRASSGGTSAFKRKCYFLCVLKNEYASGRKRVWPCMSEEWGWEGGILDKMNSICSPLEA